MALAVEALPPPGVRTLVTPEPTAVWQVLSLYIVTVTEPVGEPPAAVPVTVTVSVKELPRVMLPVLPVESRVVTTGVIGPTVTGSSAQGLETGWKFVSPL